MSELIKKLEAFRANLVGEDMNYRACLVDEAIERIAGLEAELARAKAANVYDAGAHRRVSEMEADLAGCRLQLSLAPTYEKMIAHHGSQEARIRELETALRTICDPAKCAWSAGAMFHIAENALRGREGTARDIQASGQIPGSAEVTLTCKVVDVAPKGIAIESPPPLF